MISWALGSSDSPVADGIGPIAIWLYARPTQTGPDEAGTGDANQNSELAGPSVELRATTAAADDGDDSFIEPEGSPERERKGDKRRKVTAETMAAKQRDISVS